MSARVVIPVAAVVLAGGGGPRLARALASVGWARERIVFDPAGHLAGTVFPGGVRRSTRFSDATDVTDQPWVLLLAEEEIVPPPLADAIAAAVMGPGDASAFRIGREVRGFGAILNLAGAPVRLARRGVARLSLSRDLTPTFVASGGRLGALRPRLIVEPAAHLTAAVEHLDADTTALAALLHARRVRSRLRLLWMPALAAGAQMLAGRARGKAGWGRWCLAVFAGYRALVAYAKLWELERAEAR